MQQGGTDILAALRLGLRNHQGIGDSIDLYLFKKNNVFFFLYMDFSRNFLRHQWKKMHKIRCVESALKARFQWT